MSRISLKGVGIAGQRVLLVGYGVIGKELSEEITSNGGLIVALIEDNVKELLQHTEVAVYPTDSLKQAILNQKPTILIVAASMFTATRFHEIADLAKEFSLPLMIVPERSDFHLGKLKEVTLRSPTLDDLFARNSLLVDFEGVENRLNGARVLISGAGGSIGSRIALHSLALGASSVGLLDRDDCLLHDIAVEMTGEMHNPRAPLFVSDVQFSRSIDEVFSKFRPDIVIHAAAQKHVTTLETTPQNALAINILGTINMLQSSERYEVKEFINISTDKAASLENVLGLSKYVTERLTAGSSIENRKSVRFGNVLGSRASVLNTFRIQAQFFGKLTVRGTETTRFFMTNNEAASLSLSALTSDEQTGTYVFDMGQPVRILDLAQEVSASQLNPPEIAIEELQSGEVDHERLFRPDEQPEETSISNVYRVTPKPILVSDALELMPSLNEIYDMSPQRARLTIENLLLI
jgi:FlaA1/EpsC-like NDP-sugar epimerase